MTDIELRQFITQTAKYLAEELAFELLNPEYRDQVTVGIGQEPTYWKIRIELIRRHLQYTDSLLSVEKEIKSIPVLSTPERRF